MKRGKTGNDKSFNCFAPRSRLQSLVLRLELGLLSAQLKRVGPTQPLLNLFFFFSTSSCLTLTLIITLLDCEFAVRDRVIKCRGPTPAALFIWDNRSKKENKVSDLCLKHEDQEDTIPWANHPPNEPLQSNCEAVSEGQGERILTSYIYVDKRETLSNNLWPR